MIALRPEPTVQHIETPELQAEGERTFVLSDAFCELRISECLIHLGPPVLEDPAFRRNSESPFLSDGNPPANYSSMQRRAELQDPGITGPPQLRLILRPTMTLIWVALSDAGQLCRQLREVFDCLVHGVAVDIIGTRLAT
jgi:hypothetical protein